MHYLRFILAAILILSSVSAMAQRDPVDKIAVVVGEDIILASEVAAQVQMIAFQTGQRPKSEEEVIKLQLQVLDKMVSEQLFLMEAKKDTTISLRPEEVEQALDEQIAQIASNFPNEQEFLTALASEGMTLRDIKKRYRSELENQLLRNRYVQSKLYSVSVSKYEVEKFYSEFKDSIPLRPEAIKLAQILLEIKPSAEVEDSVKAMATDIRKNILNGADFATLSAQFSDLGAGANGGDLGYIARDDVVPEFSRAAFKLNVGDISGVIRTQFGYHIIKCEAKRGDKLRLRHVLLAVTPSVEDTLRVKKVADSLLSEARNGADFAELAKAFSDDDDTRGAGGELGWFAAAQLPPDFKDAVSGWKTPGEVRGPVSSRFGFHILKLLDYQDEKEISLKDDFDQVKQMARQDKTGKMVDEWIGEIKKRTYIDYRIDTLHAN